MTTPALTTSEPEVRPEPRLTVRAIAAIVAADFGLSLSLLLSERRTKDVVEPRQILMWLASQHTAASLPQIGRAIGGRDHTTVLHGIRTITERAEVDLGLAGRLQALGEKINAAEIEAQDRRATTVRPPLPEPKEPAPEAQAPVFVMGPSPGEVRVLEALAEYLKARDHAVAHAYTVGEAAARRRADNAYRVLREAHDEMAFAKREARQ